MASTRGPVVLVGGGAARELVAAALHGAGELVPAADWPEAKRLMRDGGRLALVDLDCLTPPMPESVREFSIAFGLFSLIVFGKADDRSRAADALEAGAFAHLYTPLQKAEVRTWVTRALERRRLSEELVQAQTSIRELLEALHEFLASVSHDLRTPLAIMHGYADTLLHYGDKLDAQKKNVYLGYIREGSTNLTNQLEDFLTLSKRTVREINPEPLNLPALLRRVHAATREAGRGMELQLTFPERDGDIVSDRERLEHALRCVLGETLCAFEGAARIYAAVIPQGDRMTVHFAGRAICDAPTAPERDLQPHEIGLMIARCILKVLGGNVWRRGEGEGLSLTLSLPTQYKPSKRHQGGPHG